MIRDAADVKRRVMTQPLVVRNHKPLHGFATALFLAGALASSGVTAAIGEQFCTHGGQDPQTIASHVIPMPGAGLPRHLVRNRSATSARAARRLLSRAARSLALSHRLPA
jgi:hypothetical protein